MTKTIERLNNVLPRLYEQYPNKPFYAADAFAALRSSNRGCPYSRASDLSLSLNKAIAAKYASPDGLVIERVDAEGASYRYLIKREVVNLDVDDSEDVSEPVAANTSYTADIDRLEKELGLPVRTTALGSPRVTLQVHPTTYKQLEELARRNGTTPHQALAMTVSAKLTARSGIPAAPPPSDVKIKTVEVPAQFTEQQVRDVAEGVAKAIYDELTLPLKQAAHSAVAVAVRNTLDKLNKSR